MAGNPEFPSNGGGSPGPPPESKPKVKTFACSQCGASISLRNPESLSVVCSSCQSIIDATDENYRILQAYYGKTDMFAPAIELGSRGELFGKKWEVIGFLVRQEISSNYFWDEYLLFNPYQGYRWLSCASGHWSFATPIKDKPKAPSWNIARYKGRQYKLFDRGPVTVLYVLGEFYWKVTRDYRVTMHDYICPPDMLTAEEDLSEFNWSLNTYIEPDQVRNAFKVKSELFYAPTGVAPNQPYKGKAACLRSGWWWAGFVVILMIAQFWHFSQSGNHLAFREAYPFIPNEKSTASTTTKVFELTKDIANVAINVDAPVDNSWFYLGGELVNNDNGTSYPFERSVEYYYGVDSDGTWTEGSTTSRLLVQSVPAGKYYIDLDYESGGFNSYTPSQPREFTLSVWRDTPTWSNFFWCLFFVSIFPIALLLRWHSFETMRWSASDYSPYKQSGGDDDD